MADLIITERSNIVALADAIREKTGTTDSITLGDMISDVEEGVGGIDTSDATAAAGDIMLDKTAYADGEKVTGSFTIDSELNEQDDLIAQIQSALESKASATPTLQSKIVTPSTSSQIVEPDSGYNGLSSVIVNAMATATQATPSISVNSSGLITASATQTEGYVTSGTKSATKQLTTQAATTYTPTTTNQTIAKGTYCSGVQTIKGDANLKAENIAEGVSIFGVEGTYSGGGSGGASVCIETCSVKISTSEGFFTRITYSCLENDKVISKYNDRLQQTSINLDNIVCGTFITFYITSTHLRPEIAAGAEILANICEWHITAKAGETAIIQLYNPF